MIGADLVKDRNISVEDVEVMIWDQRQWKWFFVYRRCVNGDIGLQSTWCVEWKSKKCLYKCGSKCSLQQTGHGLKICMIGPRGLYVPNSSIGIRRDRR